MKTMQVVIEGKKIAVNFDKHFSNLVNINQSLNKGSYDSYQRRGRIFVDVPLIVGITGACENIDTLFKVGNRLDLPLFFTQTGQLALEQALQSFHSVCTVIHSGRDEEEEDDRHLRQFRLTEEEFDCTTIGITRSKFDEDVMYEALLKNIQITIQSMMLSILKDNEDTLQKVYKRDVKKLRYAATHDFLRITYEDAVKLLQKNGFPGVSFGDDLKADHEAKVVKLLNKGEELPVFIMKYPKEIKFFNMKVSTKDPRLALSADLIFPYSGEGTGSAVREHIFEKLNERLITSKMYELHIKRGGKYEDFKWYLDIMKKDSTNPHAGYGIGNERVVQYVLGMKDIRHASVFSMLNTQTGDWSRKRYGQSAIVAATPKKHVLLSIGKQTNKRFLLPYVKSLAKANNVTLYATKNTHKFLSQNRVLTSMVHKISDMGESPNINDLISRRVFDLIVNIPTREKVKESNEFTDGKLIRRGAVQMGISLITDPEVAGEVLNNLSKTNGFVH